MLKNKNDRAGQARSTGQTSAGERRFLDDTTRRALRQLAERAAENARRCERNEIKRKFERIARFLERCARGGVK